MFKNKKKNTGIEEANSEAALTLTDKAVRILLDRIDYENYTPSSDERAALKKVTRISLSKIPPSINLLTNLQELTLNGMLSLFISCNGIGVTKPRYRQFNDISAPFVCYQTIRKRLSPPPVVRHQTIRKRLSPHPRSFAEFIDDIVNYFFISISEPPSNWVLPSFEPHIFNRYDLLKNRVSLSESDYCHKYIFWKENSISLRGIEKLANLQTLILNDAQITSLWGIEELTNLLRLDLRGTQIDSNELKRLAKLKNLRMLDLRHLKLTRIPPHLLELNLPFNTTSKPIYSDDRGIYLYGTELTQQPLSLFDQDRKLIEEYYKSKMDSVGEAKVIFLGDGDVGKTHTIERIKKKGKPIDRIKGKTRGISITPLNNFYDSGLNIQFWDFGGQDIMHSMHRCFLTERTCYVVVVTPRQEGINKRARYWLNNIKSFAPNSPVILFENIWDDDHISGDLDKRRLREEFPNILRIRSFSAACAKKSEFDLLIEDIRAVAGELDSVKMEFPEKWARIREELLKLKVSKKPFIEKDDYYKLCRDCGEYSYDIAKWLLSWFNDLGVCFSYHQDRDTHEELDNYKLLAPNWIINAMYTIINNAGDVSKNGIIYHEDIKRILKEGSASLARSLDSSANYEGKTDYILEVMRKFQLSHRFSVNEEFIPALCKNETPENLRPETSSQTKHMTYKYTYQFLPNNVVHQMMIYWNERTYLDPTKTWLKGFRIDSCPKGISVVIDMGNDDNVLIIDVYSLDGTLSYKMFDEIRSSIKVINERLGLSPYESVSVEKSGIKQDLRTSLLFNLWKDGKSTFPITDGENYVDFKLLDVLECIIEPEKLKKAEDSNGSTGKGAKINKQTVINQFVNCTIVTNDAPLTAITNNVTNGYTDEQMTELFKAMNEHQDRITKEVLDTIAEMVEKQGKQQPNLDADKIKEIITELKTPLPKTPMQRIQTCFDNIAKGWTMGKDILKWIIPVAIAQHAPEITDAVQTLLK